jgi:hypothetical protein
VVVTLLKIQIITYRVFNFLKPVILKEQGGFVAIGLGWSSMQQLVQHYGWGRLGLDVVFLPL